MANNKHHYYNSLIKRKRLLDYIFIKYLATVRRYQHTVRHENKQIHTKKRKKEKSSSITTAEKSGAFLCAIPL